MTTRSRKSFAKVSSSIPTEFLKKKWRVDVKPSNIEVVNGVTTIVKKRKKTGAKATKKNTATSKSSPWPLPATGKSSNEIDKGFVTLDEVEYQRLREIEDNIRELFVLAKKVNGAVAFGRLGPQYKEPKLVTKLRELLGVEAYVQPIDNTKGS